MRPHLLVATAVVYGLLAPALATRADARGMVEPGSTSVPDTARTVAVANSPRDVQQVAARILDRADGLVGTPYRDGGDSPGSGFDAAGFLRYVFGREGIRLRRTARDMSQEGEEVSLDAGCLRPGDLLFFARDRSRVDRVAIYVGRDRVIHASAGGGAVRYDTLGVGERGTWFAEHLVTARRVLGDP